jgi:DNA-binding FrmR family transcriptional regulator
MKEAAPALEWKVTDDLSASEIAICNQQALVRYLTWIEGQVCEIRRMIEEPRPDLEVLEQMAAAEAALNEVGRAVRKHHVRHCLNRGMSQGVRQTRKQLNELVDIFDRFGA